MAQQTALRSLKPLWFWGTNAAVVTDLSPDCWQTRSNPIASCLRNLSTIAGVRAARALNTSADQLLLPPRGYSFFSSAVQFSTTVTDSDDVVAVSIMNRSLECRTL